MSSSLENNLTPAEIMREAWYAHRTFVYYEPHLKQKQFHDLGKTARERLFLAGNRTGKTYGGAIEVCMHLSGVYPEDWSGYRFDKPIIAWAIGVSNETVRSTLQQYYIGDPKAETPGGLAPAIILSTTMRRGLADAVDTVRVRHSSGGQSILCFKSYQQGREALQGARVDLIHCDEEPPHSLYMELLMRLMSVDGVSDPGMMMITATPLLGMTNTILRFTNEDEAREGEALNGRGFVQAGWNDNPYLQDAEKQQLRKSMAPHELEAREKGIPSLGSGMVYPVAESAITCNPFEIPEFWPRVYGLDFGWTAPTAALFGAHDRDNDVIYFYGEYALAELTPQQHASNLLKLGADWIPGVFDPSGLQSSIKDGDKLAQVYHDVGLIYLYKADNAKEAGIAKTLTRMQNGQLKLFNTLSQTLKELRIYGRDENGIVRKGNDHLMDCMRYVVMSGLGLARPQRLPRTFDSIRYQGGGYL